MLPVDESGAIGWGIAVGISAVAIALGILWFKETNVVTNPWMIRAIGFSWITLFAAAVAIIFPDWRWAALVIFVTGNVWALYVTTPKTQNLWSQITQGWQWPFRSPRKSSTKYKTNESAPADWLVEIANSDRQNLPNLIKVIFVHPDEFLWQGVVKSEPFIDVIVEVVNLSIFDVDFSAIEGSLTINDTRCNVGAQSGGRRVLRGEPDVGRIRIHQPITPQTAQVIREAACSGEAVKVRLSSCSWTVTPEDPEGIAQPFRIVVSGEYEVIPKWYVIRNLGHNLSQGNH
jgi:hypothetical protein